MQSGDFTISCSAVRNQSQKVVAVHAGIGVDHTVDQEAESGEKGGKTIYI